MGLGKFQIALSRLFINIVKSIIIYPFLFDQIFLELDCDMYMTMTYAQWSFPTLPRSEDASKSTHRFRNSTMSINISYIHHFLADIIISSLQVKLV